MESTTENNVEIIPTTSTEDKIKDTEQDATKDITLRPKEIERSSSPFEYQKVAYLDPLSNNKEKQSEETETKSSKIINGKQGNVIKQDQTNEKENTKFEFTRSLEADPLSSQRDGDSKHDSINEKQITASTVESVVRQHKLSRKPSPQQDVQFDFGKFLEQMSNPSAQNIARYVKNFEKEFERKAWTVNEQIRIIHDFLDFIALKMRNCELWRNSSGVEFENAKEGMEKLVMNRLYKLTFSPAIIGSVTTDDRERDEILKQKIQIFRWVKEEHLDIPNAPHNEQFLDFAKKELLKINYFKAPRDKLICILNCCKVIFGLIRHVDGEEGADKFLPILIFVVLAANPDHLVSNVQYISRFRNPEKLQSEAGYYLSSLMGAISFIENMDASSLSITQEDFDKNIEVTMKELDKERPKIPENTREISYDNVLHPSRSAQHLKSPILNPAQARALFENGRNFAQRTIQKPLNIVGKIFAEISNEANETLNTRQVNSNLEVNSSSQSSSRSISPQRPPSINEQPVRHRRLSDSDLLQDQGSRERSHSVSSRSSRASNDFSDVQAEVARVSEAEFQESLAKLISMFPNMDSEVCESVLQANEWSMTSSIERLLEMSEDPNIRRNDLNRDNSFELNNISDNDNNSHEEKNELFAVS
ncbi:hypothetical protein RclHR1_02660026 [Rhizophagus clarus]|uniref:Guanine nucleotide exchange factor Vps9 n=1 Tax=Rhizophagus clarus TaxID=94130 RepID=A0A2Z6R235_9GLOM|nr:hypothetical protein RclHR1_02660026 [Rhizophagus clarus]GES77673.1 guanine nucleotide exchange factor Vps9 [Rhizophagus clarus]